MSNQRNMILAIVLTGLLLFGWDAAVRYFYPHAARPTPAASPAPKEQAAPGKPTREGGIERDFVRLRDELCAALARAKAGKGDAPRKARNGR